MKRTLCTLLLATITFNAFSQLEKGSKMLTLNGMCSVTNTSSGTYRNSLEEHAKSLSLGGSYSFVQKNFLFGFGLDLGVGLNKQTFKTEILNTYNQRERDVVFSSLILPNFYVGYYRRIFDKLYFTTNLKVGVGGVFSSLSSVTTFYEEGVSILSSELVYKNGNTMVAIAGIHPEFTYFFSKKIGISLYTGGIEYAMADWNFASSNFMINFNPNNWQVGLKIAI